MEKIALQVLGVTTQQRYDSGAYALILAEKNGTRRIAPVIGRQEAQAIVVQLENWQSTRPLIYDIVLTLCRQYGIRLIEAVITNHERGIFYAELVFKKDGDTDDDIVRIDARTSDAVALSLKFNCPLYTYEPVFERVGFNDGIDSGGDNDTAQIQSLNDKELDQMLSKAVAEEDYELASKIRDEKLKRGK